MIRLSRAFTLLELLVVIGIIAILIALGTVSYSTAQKKARDSKRKGDIRSIQNCLEQYYTYNNNFKYPTLSNGAAPSTLSCGGTTMSVPTDPLGSSYVVSNTSVDNSTYTICPPEVRTGYRLETENCTTSDTSCCVSNQQ